jgi:carotenoid cleavage dioxygenase
MMLMPTIAAPPRFRDARSEQQQQWERQLQPQRQQRPQQQQQHGPAAQWCPPRIAVRSPVVRGRLPACLDGTFVRIGPGDARSGQLSGPLSGDPVVAGLRLRGGRAEWFVSRPVQTDRVSRALGELPAPGPRRGLSDEANAGLIRHAGRLLALGDAGVLPYELGPDLSTRARHDFDGTLPLGFSAHPEHDPVTGELFAVAYYHEAPYVQHIIVGVDGHVRRAETISVKNTPMMHAYSLTEHYAVLYDLPVTFNPTAAAAGLRIPYAWDDSHGARLGILPREGGDADIRWIEIEPCYVFHAMNAFERPDGRIVLDVARHERAFDRDPVRPGEAPPALWRWTVDLDEHSVAEEQIDDRVQEHPVVDFRYKGREHRYGFTVSASRTERPYGGSALFAHDFVAGRTETHDFGPGCEVGDPVFVPRAPDAPEGDGWVMAYVRDVRQGVVRFVLLDTADFTGPATAVVELPAAGPRGFHSAWIVDA